MLIFENLTTRIVRHHGRTPNEMAKMPDAKAAAFLGIEFQNGTNRIARHS